MPSGKTLERPRRKTGGFAGRLLNKQLEERSKKPSLEFVKPAVPDNIAEEKKVQKEQFSEN